MGKRIVDEDMNLNIIINGDEGKKALYELEERVRDLNSENEKLERGLQGYEKQIAKNESTLSRYSQTLDKQADREEKQSQICERSKERYRELSVAYKGLSAAARESSYGEKMAKDLAKAEHSAIQSSRAVMDAREQQKHLGENIEKLSAETEKLKQKRDADTNSLNTNKAAVSESGAKISALRKNLDVTTLSLDELNREIALTNANFRKTDPNDPKWKEYQATLVKLRMRHQELSAQGQDTKGVLCRMADGVNKYWSMVVSGLGSFMGLFLSIKGAVSKYVEFEDILSDTQKTTGLTKREVEELNESLQRIDTRTGQEELQGLARVGGKLGIEGKANLEGFVRAADQINVALKEDLGGDTEEAINQVGKLVDIFKVKDDFGIEQGMLKVGSVINELGAASTANEGYIVEFSKRVAGVAPSAGISVSAVMGLGATLDQLGQQSEASSTVYSQMMAKMFKNTAAYADIAGLSLTEFSDLMNKDANEAFIRVLEGLKGNNEGMKALVGNLGDMELNGVRATTILGTLADNTGTLREQQRLANEAFREGSSLTDEFNIKNNNAAAQAEKQRKIREQLIVDLGQKLQPVMVAGNSTMNTGLQILNTLVGFVVKYGATLAKVSALAGAYTIGVKAATIANKLHLTSVTGLTGGLKKLFATFSLSPWGMVTAAVAGLGYAVYKMVTYSTEAEKAQKRLQGSLREAEAGALAEQRELVKLKVELSAAAKGSAEYDRIKNRIVENYGKYDKNLKDEIEKVGFLDSTYQKLTESIRQSFGARQYEKFRQDESDHLDQVLSDNLGKIQDRLLEDLGDEAGERYYSAIRNALLKGEELSAGIVAVLDKVQDKGTVIADGRLDGYIRRIREAQQNFENIDQKAKIKFGIEVPADVPRSLEALNAELSLAEKKLEDLRRTKPDIFSEDEIARQEQYIAGLKDCIKISEQQVPDSVDDGKPAGAPVRDYDGEIVVLKQRYAANKLTKEEYEKQLDALELAHLQYRLKVFEGTEEKRVELQQKIADKQVAIREKQDKGGQAADKDRSKDYVAALLADADSAVQKEELAFAERLRKADLHGKDRETLAAEQLKALEVLERQHRENLEKIGVEAEQKEKDEYMKGITARIKNMETAHRMEAEQRKAKYADDLAKEDSAAGRNRLRKDFGRGMADLAEGQAAEMADLLNEVLAGIEVDSVAGLGEVVLSDEERVALVARLNDAKTKVEELKKVSDYAGAENYGVDILGMDAGQWEVFFEHLSDGKLGVEDLQVAVEAVSAAWATYAKLRSAQEKKELKQYEQKTRKEKAALDKQLEQGAISQEQYNARTSQLDAEMDAKKDAIAQKQMEREKRMAIFQTIMNTAAGIVKLWVQPGFPAAIPMALVLGALGAVQVATIAAAQYAEGKYPVIGEDDGRTYQAGYAGEELRTGIYQKPTLGLFSEKEPEMVVDGATTRKLVFNYPQIYQSIMDVSRGRTPQYAAGRYPATMPGGRAEDVDAPQADPEMKRLLEANLAMMEELKWKRVEIPWYGRGGIDEKMKQSERYEQNIIK